MKLLNVFQSNSLIDPESYVSELVIGLILTPEDAELIRRCPTSKNRQEVTDYFCNGRLEFK